MAMKSPEGQTPSAESSPGWSVARNVPSERYARLRSANAGHKLQALLLPSEELLRAAAVGPQPTVGPPPRLPHQLSPALSSVLLGWRSLYESCRTATVLQALVGECFAPDAVFEDAMVSARGQEAIYQQFALLGVLVRAVQVAAYSLSVAPLSTPVVAAPTLALLPPGPKLRASEPAPQPSQPPPPQRPGTRPGLRARPVAASAPEPVSGRGAAGEAGAGPLAPPPPPPPPHLGVTQLHLTRVAVENVQCFTLGVPSWVGWLLGSKGPGLQVNLYVTSILIVVSDAPLAMGPGSEPGALAGTAADVTARRLAGAAAALGGVLAAAAAAGGGRDTDGSTGGGGGGAGGGEGGGGASGSSGFPAWRIVHQVDRWHNVPLVWWRLRRGLCLALNAVLSPLLGI